jgi:hypothetical protein
MSDQSGGARGRFSGLSGVLAGSAAAITAVGGLRIDAIAGRNTADIDIAKLQAQQEKLRRLGTSSDDLAKQLGATTCAEGSSFSGATFPGG